MQNVPALLLGLAIGLGFAVGGWYAGRGIVDARAMERSVEVKGLAEREVPADVAIWPVRFVAAGNDLEDLIGEIERKTAVVTAFLGARGFTDDEIDLAPPAIVDKAAQAWGDGARAPLRYSATQTITVYSRNVDRVVEVSRALIELGKSGIAIVGDDYGVRTQYLFTGLNELKPAMVEEATRNAREVAEKFAADSDSRLGGIRTARQGQFSIEDRDSNTPHIKNVRVVSTVEYYLVDG